MAAKHLTIGSPKPGPSAGKLRIYSMRFCPYAERLHLTLNAKNIPHEVVWINLSDKPEWFTSVSPGGKVPVLETETGEYIGESLITAEYVDERYPSSQLSSKDPLRRAQDRLIIENFNKPIGAYYKAIFQKEDTSKDFMDGIEEIQNQLNTRNTKFLHGDQPGFVDFMVWPWFERFPHLHEHGGHKFHPDLNKFSRLMTWSKDMKQEAPVMKHLLSSKIHDTFIRGRLSGENKYDGIIEAA